MPPQLYVPQESVGYFSNLIPQTMETFADFLTRVTTAIEKHILSGSTKDILVKQLTWEGTNTTTHNAIAPVQNEDIHKWDCLPVMLTQKKGPFPHSWPPLMPWLKPNSQLAQMTPRPV